MGKLQKDWPRVHYHQLRKEWHRMKRRIEESAEEPGEALELFTEIFATKGWDHWRNTSKAIFEASEPGKKKRRKWNQRGHEKRKADPDYKADKKAYDAERYQQRKAARKAAAGGDPSALGVECSAFGLASLAKKGSP
jgi:hypothetical protein